MENRLEETLNNFKWSLLETLNKSQHSESSSLKGNRSENIGKSNQGQDIGYPHMKVRFPRWKMEIRSVGSRGLKSISVFT
ncbi:hypothetical protein BHM03_00045977 [Ensete ventricosum]|nr:hypothetical protein BHM03_00045977 [Ensete ventricosum]